MEITVTVNGTAQTHPVEPRTLLVDFVRTRCALTGTHVGCDTTNCGACTVLLDGTPVKSCTMLAVQADGAAVTTVEGLRGADGVHPIQAAFKEQHGLQCGFCTPGMMLVAKALLEENPAPSDDDVRWAISGNLGTVKLVADRERGLLIGATLVTPRAGEIVGELVLAIKLRTPLKQLADVIHPFPAFNRVLGATVEELAAKTALQDVA